MYKGRIAKATVTAVFGLLLGMVLGSAAYADIKRDDSFFGDEETEKAPLQLDFRALKDVYSIDEAIRFRVRTSSPAYIYLFAIGEDGEQKLIFPNRYEKGNYLKAGGSGLLPSRKSAFRSDTPGIESFMLIASERPLKIGSGEILGGWHQNENQTFGSEGFGTRLRADWKQSYSNGTTVKVIDVLIEGQN